MNQNIVREWYEKEINIQEMMHWENGKLKKWEEKVVEHFPKGSRVLDIGCGLGREAYALNERGFEVTGIDISKGIIEEVRRFSKANGYDIPFLLYDGKELPFVDGSFDAVIIWAQTFGLLYGDEYKNSFLKECNRVLREGGFLSYSGHDYKFEEENYKQYTEGRKFYAYANTEMYWETFLPEELSSYAQKAGFQILVCERGEIYKPEDGIVLHCLCRK